MVYTSPVAELRQRTGVVSTAPTSNLKARKANFRHVLRDRGIERLYERYQLANSDIERRWFLESLAPTIRERLRYRVVCGPREVRDF